MNKEINKLLNIIKFSPLIIILLACTFIIIIIYQEKEKEFQKEKIYIKEEYINEEKDEIKSTINTIHNYIQQQKERSKIELKNDIKRRMNNAHKIATNIFNKNKDSLSKDEIIQHIKNSLEVLRFNEGRGYFSIHTIEGENILHPINKEFEGKSVFNRKDAAGNYPIQNAIDILKNKDEGFMSWYYYKPDNKIKRFEKIGIVRKFKPYNLIITTAEYVADFKDNLQKNILNHISKLSFNNNFVFVFDYKGKMLVHPSKEILNHNIFEEKKFSYGNDLFKEFISKDNKTEDAFLSYELKIHPRNDIEITYVRKFEDWSWVIASGFKLSNANIIIEKRKTILEDKYDKYKKDVLLFGFIFTMILVFFSYFIAKLIENKFLEYREKQAIQLKKELISKDKIINLENIFNSFFELSINLQIIARKEGEIIQINSATESILGYKKEELIHSSFLDLIHPKDIEKTTKEMQKLQKGEIVFYFENRFKHKNGTYVDLAWSANTNSSHDLIYASAQNITNAKLTALENKKKEKLLYQQNKLAAMGEMLGNIAHQWRQPLSTISTGATGVKLQNEMNLLDSVNLNETMDTINDSAQYLSQTIEDFRGFFDPRNSKQSEFLISHAINKTLELIKSQFAAKDIEIIRNIEDISLLSQENELIQVLVNIINNAKDALEEIKNQKKMIFINTYVKENKLFIEIKDNAKGVNENIIDRVFEPYFSTKHQSQGTGIGLYMSQNIIVTHLNGTITVENDTFMYQGIEYIGANFCIKLDIL